MNDSAQKYNPNYRKEMYCLLVDDHPIFRSGMRKICELYHPDSSFYEAGDVETAITFMQQIPFNLVFLDINLGNSNGIQFLRDYPDLVSNTNIIMLSMYDDKPLVQEAFSLGAKAFLSKDADDEEILSCVELVLKGQKYVNSSILNVFTHDFSAGDRGRNPYDLLTKTERTILKLVSNSLSSKDIAEEMNISHRTVENHRTNICSKLGLQGTNALTRYALEHRNTFW